MSELIACVFDGRAFVPRTRYQEQLARARFGEGEIVTIAAENERSAQSHRHMFATIHDLWVTLPDSVAEMPYARTAETLRKHALVVTGYADCQTIDAGSKAAAERIGAYVSTLANQAHGYAIVKVSGSVVRCYTPQSQSVRSMGSKRFQESKTAVLEWIEALVRGEAA